MKKKKIYVLMVSRVFPKTHPRAGENTYFSSSISLALGTQAFLPIDARKIHTIRGSYDLWKKRADKINAGEAVLSLRQWSGEPYKSKQVEFMQLEKIGIQHCEVWSIPLSGGVVAKAVRVEDRITGIDTVAKNDGLSVDDFCKWFKKDLDGCVIHFSDFLYNK